MVGDVLGLHAVDLRVPRDHRDLLGQRHLRGEEGTERREKGWSRGGPCPWVPRKGPPRVLTSESKASRVQAKRWLLMPSVVKTHSSLGCSTAFSAQTANWGGSAPSNPASPQPSEPPQQAPCPPPDEATVTRTRASSRAPCSSEYCSFSVTEARMSCTEAERRLRMVTYEWSGM